MSRFSEPPGSVWLSKALRLYGVTDRRWVGESSLCRQVELALEGGVTMVQLREKGLADDVFLEEARELRALTRRHHVPLIINDRVDIALACDADGVHIGQGDGDIRDVRARVGQGRILGVTAKTPEQARRAQEEGADYLGCGAVFGTSTKEDASRITLGQLKAVCQSVSIPVVAIGGIHGGNVMGLSGSGLAGAAVVSGVFGQKDVRAAAAGLRRSLDQMTGGGDVG